MELKTAAELELVSNSIKCAMDENRTMSATAYDAWFSDFRLIALDDEKIVFSTGTEMKRKIILSKFTEFVTLCVSSVIGSCPKIEIICEPSDLPQILCTDFIKTSGSPCCQGLIEDYTFDNFVVGSSNQFAHACAVAVSNEPAGSHNFNPLFIYGPSGLGKTHLMYAIANKVHEEHPEMSVICVKSEDFMNELIESISRRSTHTFREKYRKADMLLIDDVQFISGKTSTQEEFFHTFNALYEAKKQIILTSDRPPREMYTLEDRIKTRFSQGMLADVQPPEYELRLAILRKKAEKSKINIPAEVLAFLAERLNSNIREIEGAIKKIGAMAFLEGKPITLEMVKTSIPEFLRENKPVAETVDKILEVTARKYDVTVEDILGTKRTKNIKTARNAAMYITRQVLNLSLPQIGRLFNRDHSTVHSNIQATETQLKTDDSLSNDISEIITEVKS